MAPREELLVILDLTSTVLRAGVGVHDLIRAPLIELPTRIGKKLQSNGQQVEDYLVGHHLNDQPPNSYQVVYPLVVDPQVGLQVTDWIGLEAIFRYAFHTSLQLPRPPLVHPTVLSLPPGLPRSLVDQFHLLLFERLLVPSLLCSSRPFFAAAATGQTSCIVLDLGWRGEGIELSVVHENQVMGNGGGGGGERLKWCDEGVLDDYCAVKVWEQEGKKLEESFRLAKEEEEGKTTTNGEEGEKKESYDLTMEDRLEGVRSIVQELKQQDLIRFESDYFKPSSISTNTSTTIGGGGVEEGEFDVAKVVVEGKVSEIVSGKKKKQGGGSKGEETSEGDFVSIRNPFSPPPPIPSLDLSIPTPEQPPHSTIEIGPSRHRYLEPLFFPQVLSETLSSRNDAATEIGLNYFDGLKEEDRPSTAGVQELMGLVLMGIKERGVREIVGENVVVISSGRVANNRALGSTLIPLLSPYSIPSSIDDQLQQTEQERQQQQFLSGGTTTPTGNNGNANGSHNMVYRRTPEYFSNFKGHAGDWAVYLGCCIMGKLLIGDQQSKLFMTKAEYTEKGPAAYRLLESIN